MSMIGKSLVHYEISTEIGRGGMGEVYQAKDTKLGRDVAIKVLPEEFALDTDRVARFQREAKLLASLNHPNIAAIYGLEESEDTHFLVMELIEGDTLRDRIKSGPIPVEEALKLALQMAEALEAAHEKGVIHRDLKPANIKVTPDDKAKILDFGLAKAYVGNQGDMNLADSPTISAAATQQGVILGTAAYMSPEQAKGKTVDKRADIWAFGVVLFEMLTGRQLFTGETVSETLAGVIKSEPEWKNLPPNLHPRIRLMLERCLEKNPKNRYSGVNDARVDIEKALTDPGGVYAQPIAATQSKVKSKQMLLWTSMTVVLLVIVGMVVWNLKTPEQQQLMKFEYDLPDDHQFKMGPYGNVAIAISPDGSRFVYDTTNGLYLHSMDQSENKFIQIPDGSIDGAFFSPDGKWVGYYSPSDRKLKKIAISSGMPVDLCYIETIVVGTQWRKDNTILFSLFPGGIMKIPDNGGTPEPLFKADKIGLPMFASILPDEKNVLFTSFFDVQTKRIMIYSLETGEIKVLFPGQGAYYYPTGHIIYAEVNSNNICAIPFDLDKLEVTGGAVPLMDGVMGYSLSENGTLIYVKTTSQSNDNIRPSDVTETRTTLWWVDRNGREEQIQTNSYAYNYLRISPNGNQIALTATVDRNVDIYTLNLVRDNTHKRLTFNEGYDQQAVWSPDGQRIAYTAMSPVVSKEGGLMGIFIKAADGTGEPEYLCSSPGKAVIPYSWSEDGKILLTGEVGSDFINFDIGMVSLEGDRTNKLLLKESYSEKQPQLSPNGRWLVYTSDRSGRTEIYVRPFPDVNGGQWQISTNGGNSPRWSSDGTELFYLIGEALVEKVMRVKVETETKFDHGNPEELFKGNYLGILTTNCFPYDVHPDGKRFLMMKSALSAKDPTAATGPRKINIVLNWDLELKQRVPVD